MQFALHQGAVVDPGLHAGIEEAHRVAASRLGLVHGEVGALQQFVDARLMTAEQGDADAGRTAIFLAAELIGLIERAEHLSGSGLRPGRRFAAGVAEVLDHEHKFVTTESGHRIAFPHAGLQAACHLDQQSVAHIVTERVVERLEVVQIQEQQCTITAVAAAGGHRLLQAIEQQAPIGQVSQRIVEGKVADFFLGRLACGNVLKHADVMTGCAVLILDGGDGQPFGVGLTAPASIDDFTLPDAFRQQVRPHRPIEVRVVTV